MKKPDKPLAWNAEKNEFLLKERGISFEQIALSLNTGNFVTSYPHPRFAHQKIFEVEINGYIVVVPYVEDEDKIFLKTAFYSRKANKKRRGNNYAN